MFCAAATLVAAASPARADEPIFGFTYTTDLLPQGKSEVEQWLTWRRQKAHGDFNLWEGRSEFSYGVTDAFQLSGYLNYDWTQAFHNAVNRTTEPPAPFSDVIADPNAHFDRARFIGGSVEGIWRVLSPYIDPIGLAFYLQPTIGENFRELQSRVILQEDFLDDRLIVAANLTWQPDIRLLPANPSAPPGTTLASPNTDVKTAVNWSTGLSYRFAPNLSFAWEFDNERVMNGWAIFARSHWTDSAYYTGPTLHYGGEHFFATLTAFEQLPFAKDYANAGVLFQGRDFGVNFEKFRFRFRLGYYF